jgi:hypothetical protein
VSGLALLLALAGGVQVDSNSACPAAADVQSQLAALLPIASNSDRASVIREAEVVRLVLARGDGSVTVTRELAATGSCAELATAVAVMIAAWQAQSHPELPPVPTLAPPAPAAARTLEAVPQVVASIAGADLVAGAALTTGLWGRTRGVVASAGGTVLRQRALGFGRAGWTRLTLGLGPARRLAGAHLWLDVRAEALAGLVWARGQGYASDRTSWGASPGVGAAAGLAFPWRSLLFSLELSGSAWPLAQRLVVDPAGDRLSLPRAEAHLGAGVGFRFAL